MYIQCIQYREKNDILLQREWESLRGCHAPLCWQPSVFMSQEMVMGQRG